MKHKRRISCIVLLALLAAGSVWFYSAVKSGDLFLAMGEWLYRDDPLEKADAIYVYGGGVLERPAYAAELYKKEYAPTVIVGGILVDSDLLAIGRFFNEGSVNRKVMADRGVPAKHIVQLWAGTSTYDESLELKKYVLEHRLKSIILVTSPYHSRRVGMCARRVFKDTNVKIIVAACPNTVISLENWQKDERDMLNIVIEYVKLGYYLVKFRE